MYFCIKQNALTCSAIFHKDESTVVGEDHDLIFSWNSKGEDTWSSVAAFPSEILRFSLPRQNVKKLFLSSKYIEGTFPKIYFDDQLTSNIRQVNILKRWNIVKEVLINSICRVMNLYGIETGKLRFVRRKCELHE